MSFSFRFTLVIVSLLLLIAASQLTAAPNSIDQYFTPALKRDPVAAYRAYRQVRWGQDPQLVDALLDGLRHRNPEIRLGCAQMLIERKEPRAVEPLIPLLHDEDRKVQKEVLGSLYKFSDSRFIDPLLVLAHEQDKTVRAAALAALTGYDDPRIVPAVLNLVSEQDKDAADSLAGILMRFDDPHVIQPLVTLYPKHWGSIGDTLAKFGDKAVEPILIAVQRPDLEAGARGTLLETLGRINDPRALPVITPYVMDRDMVVRGCAFNALVAMGDTGFDTVMKLLRNPDGKLRRATVEACGYSDTPHAIDILLAGAEDADAEVRKTALQHLSHRSATGNPQVTEALFAALQDPEAAVRVQALTGIAASADPRAFAAVLQMLDDPSADVCTTAAEYLGQRRDPRILEPLFKAAQRKDCPEAVLKALALQHDQRAIPLLIRKLHPSLMSTERSLFVPQDSIARVLAFLGESAIDPLLAALHDPSADIRAGAAEALGFSGSLRALEPLHAALRDPSPDVRRCAIFALGLYHDESTLPWLVESLQDTEIAVRDLAMRMLSAFHDPRMIEPLIHLAKQSLPEVTEAQLSRIMSEDDPHWIALDLKWGAFESLRSSDDPRVTAYMLKAMRSDDTILRGRAAAGGPWATDPRAQAAFLALLKDTDVAVRASAGDAESLIHDPRALPLLIANLRDEDRDVRCSACRALMHYEDATATQAIFANLDTVLKETMFGDLWPWTAKMRRLSGTILPAIQAQVARATSDVQLYNLVDLMGEVGPPAVAPLLAYLKDPDPQLRAAAIRGLGHTGDPRVEEALPRLLANRDIDIASAAASALREYYALGARRARGDMPIGSDDVQQAVSGPVYDPFIVKPLLVIFQDPVVSYHQDAGYILAEIKDPSAVDPLLEVLTSTDKKAPKSMALTILGEIGDHRAVPTLLKLLAERPRYSKRIIETLGNIGDRRAAEPLLALLQEQLGQVEGVPRYVSLSQAPGGFSANFPRISLIEALGNLREPRAVPLLLAALQEYDTPTVQAAAQALGKIGDAAAAEALFALLPRNPSDIFEVDDLRTAVATALGQLKDDRVRARLRAAIQDEHWRVRAGAAQAMGEMGEPWVVDPLISLLGDPSARVRGAAVEALGRLHDNRADAPLRKLLTDPYPEIRERVRGVVKQ